jgi:hypothetical protein
LAADDGVEILVVIVAPPAATGMVDARGMSVGPGCGGYAGTHEKEGLHL